MLAELWERLPRGWRRLLHQHSFCLHLVERDRERNLARGAIRSCPEDKIAIMWLYLPPHDDSDDWKAHLQARLVLALGSAVLTYGAPDLWKGPDPLGNIQPALEEELIWAFGFGEIYKKGIALYPPKFIRKDDDPASSPSK